jgi:hypothetical protein
VPGLAPCQFVAYSPPRPLRLGAVRRSNGMALNPLTPRSSRWSAAAGKLTSHFGTNCTCAGRSLKITFLHGVGSVCPDCNSCSRNAAGGIRDGSSFHALTEDCAATQRGWPSWRAFPLALIVLLWVIFGPPRGPDRCPLLLRQQTLAARTVEQWRSFCNRSSGSFGAENCRGYARPHPLKISAARKSVVAVTGDAARAARSAEFCSAAK